MSRSTRMPAALRARVAAADGHRCAYCATGEDVTGLPLEVDHITPASAGGSREFGNLCLACGPCNRSKARLTRAQDPLTGEVVLLFHPRRQRWSDHFAWSTDGRHIEGRTAVGRATVVALRLNRPMIVAARERWLHAGWHPLVE